MRTSSTGGSGGSGIVVLRYATADVIGYTVTGAAPTKDTTTVAGQTILSFTTVGTGAITFTEAMAATNNMAGKIGDIPSELKGDFETLIRQLKINLMTTQKEKGQDAADLISDAESGNEDYKGTISDLATEKNDVINQWVDLLDLQNKLENNITDEVIDAKATAKEKLDNLTRERDLLVGNFNFSETQNQRSKRFQAVRSKETDILNVTIGLAETLNDLYAKNAEDLIDVNNQLQELADTYGSIADVADYFQSKINDATLEWKNSLDEIADKYETITGKVMDLTNAMEGNFTDWWSPFKTDIDDFINNIVTQTEDLKGLESDEDKEIKDNLFNDPNAAYLPEDEMSIANSRIHPDNINGMSK
jgi:hypothetical protein